jgi:hypothetical protein
MPEAYELFSSTCLRNSGVAFPFHQKFTRQALRVTQAEGSRFPFLERLSNCTYVLYLYDS